MKSATCFCRIPLTIALIVTVCHASFGQTKKLDSPQHGTDKLTAVGKLPSFEHMLATALKHNPDVRAAQAALDRARLQVVKEIRAFREEWRAAKAVLAEVKTAQREVDRISRLGIGTIAGRKLLEVKYALEVAQKRAAEVEAKLNELRLLLPHLLGHAVAAKPDDNRHPGHDHDQAHHHGQAHNHRDHDTIAAPVEKMLRERLQMLREIVEFQQAGYKSSEVDFDEVASAQLDLLAAQLELGTSADERVKIRQEMLQVSRQIEEATNQLFQGNETGRADMLKATALRLRAEADLKREQFATDHQH